MPRPELHKQMRDRPNTYFVYSVDVVFAQDALTAKQLKDSDTLYWFADFEDGVHDPIIKEVLRTLKSRKQKLYIHGSIQGRFFDKVKEQLVVPNRGVAIVKDIQ